MIIDHPHWRSKWKTIPQLYINEEKIKQVNKTKYLRVIAEDSLRWEELFESAKKKVAGGLSAIENLKSTLPQYILFQVYKTLVGSHIWYADVV